MSAHNPTDDKAPGPKTKTFADLPYELRQSIYFEYFLSALDRNPKTELYRLGLMRVSRQVNREAAEAAAYAIRTTLDTLRVDLLSARKAFDEASASKINLDNLWGSNIPYATWQGQRKVLQTVEHEASVEKQRLETAIKALERRLKRIVNTAARTPRTARNRKMMATEDLEIFSTSLQVFATS